MTQNWLAAGAAPPGAGAAGARDEGEARSRRP